jgi:hypothetical protein
MDIPTIKDSWGSRSCLDVEVAHLVRRSFWIEEERIWIETRDSYQYLRSKMQKREEWCRWSIQLEIHLLRIRSKFQETKRPYQNFRSKWICKRLVKPHVHSMRSWNMPKTQKTWRSIMTTRADNSSVIDLHRCRMRLDLCTRWPFSFWMNQEASYTDQPRQI